MSTICRLCGLSCERSIDIFYRPDAANIIQLQYKIKHLLDIAVGLCDNLPHSVCLPCESRLESLWCFRNTCHQVQIKLRKTYKTDSSIIRSTHNENELYFLRTSESSTDLLGNKEDSNKYSDDVSKQKSTSNIDSATFADINASVSNTVETTLIHSCGVDNCIPDEDYNCNIEEDDSMSIASEENAGCRGSYDLTLQTTSTPMNGFISNCEDVEIDIFSITNYADDDPYCNSSSTSEKQHDKNSDETSTLSETTSSKTAQSFEGHYYRMETDMNSDLLCNRVPYLLVESNMGIKHMIYTVSPDVHKFDQNNDYSLNSGELGLYLTVQTYDIKNPIVARTLTQWVSNLLKGEISLMPYYFSWLDDKYQLILGFKCIICKHILNRNRQIVMNHIADHLLWKCHICSIFFPNITRFKNHFLQHGSAVSFECSACNKKFGGDLKKYIEHKRSHYKFQCSSCRFNCSDEDKWLTHLKEDREKSCSSDCCLLYETVDEFQKHVAKLSTIGGYVCGACGIAYHCENYMKLHLRVHGLEHGYKTYNACNLAHSQNGITEKIDRIINSKDKSLRFDMMKNVLDSKIDVNDFKCSSKASGGRVYLGFKCFICIRKRSILKSEKKFIIHIQNHFMMTCSCKQIFHKIKNLERHLKLQSCFERRICKQCKKDVWLDTSEEYLEHLSLHQQRRICIYCQDVFHISQRLASHVRIHEGGITTYICEYCNETVTGSSTRKAKIGHLKQKHPDKLLMERCVCEICGKACTSLTSLIIHKKTHKIEYNDIFICAYCSKEFNRKMYIISHIRQHMNEKVFKCDICGKSFNRDTSLYKHKLDMHSEKKHVCNECGMRFTFPSAMRDHMMRMHALLRSTRD